MKEKKNQLRGHYSLQETRAKIIDALLFLAYNINIVNNIDIKLGRKNSLWMI